LIYSRISVSQAAWNFHSVDICADSHHPPESTSLPSGWIELGMTLLSPSLHGVEEPSWFYCVHNLYKNGGCSCTVSCLVVIIRHAVMYCFGDVISLPYHAICQQNANMNV
jgi:hypothetical protein